MTSFDDVQAVKDNCNEDNCQNEVKKEITDLQNKCQDNDVACSQDEANIENDASEVKEDIQTVETTVKGDIQEEKSNQLICALSKGSIVSVPMIC